jgi:hypothetical protein
MGINPGGQPGVGLNYCVAAHPGEDKATGYAGT